MDDPNAPQIPYDSIGRNLLSRGLNSFGSGGAGGGGSKGMGFGSGGEGAGGISGGAGMGAFASPALIAALIGMGKNTEANHPNTVVGQGLLAGLGPDFNQIFKDPVGMGLPTLLGAPFLTPFTSSKEAQAAKPEWGGLFKLGF